MENSEGVPRTNRNFVRRTRPASVGTTTDAPTPSADAETTTSKYTRRGNSKFKPRKEQPTEKPLEEGEGSEVEVRTRKPFSGGSGARTDRPTRNFARRRTGGADATTKSVNQPTTTVATTIARRPFRVASRRRPTVIGSTTSTTTTTSTTQATTDVLESDEYLQDIDETEITDEVTVTPRSEQKKDPKVQRRPLVSLKVEEDQNPSASNDEEKKRQSKKYSSNFKQNQLDEVLRLKTQDAYDVDIDPTTEAKYTAESFNAETAVALAAHKLLEAPVPIIPDYEYDTKSNGSPPIQNTLEDKYTQYHREITKTPSYPKSFSTTPSYNTPTTNYIQTSTGLYSNDLIATALPSTSGFVGSKPAGFTAPTITNPGLSGVSRNLGPSTVRYLSTTEPNTATHNFDPTEDRYTDTSEKYSKSHPSTIQYLSTVDKYSGVTYDLTPTSRYVSSSESAQTISPTGRSRGRRPTTTNGLDQFTKTSQLLSPTDIFVGTSKKYSEVPTSINPTTNRYLDTNSGFTGTIEESSVTNKYLVTSDKYATATGRARGRRPSTTSETDRLTITPQTLSPSDAFIGTSKYSEISRTTSPSTSRYLNTRDEYSGISQDVSVTRKYLDTSDRYSDTATAGPSTNEYFDSTRYTGTAQNLNPSSRFTASSEKYAEITSETISSTPTYVTEDNKYTRILQEQTPTSYTGTSENYSEVPLSTRTPSRYTERGESYSTLQNLNAPNTFADTSERYTSISRRRKPSTTTTESEKYTTSELQSQNPTSGYTTESERYTEVSRRRRPSSNAYTETVKYSSETLQNSNPTEAVASTTDKSVPSRRRRPSTYSYTNSEQYTTETTSTSGPTVTIARYTNAPRRTRPPVSSYTVTATGDVTTESQNAGPTTGFTGIIERFTEASITQSPAINIETVEKITETPQIETYTNKKYSEISRSSNPSTALYLESTERGAVGTEIAEDKVSRGRYSNVNAQYTGIVQDLNPSTIRYNSVDKSKELSPSSVQYPSTTGKFVSGPVDDFSFSTAGYSSQDPSYFTREYLLASPVTKTYDDEYQYLSPVITTTETTSTTKKLGRKKTIYRRISSTAEPSSTTTTTTTPKSRRVISRKPFDKVRKVQKVKVVKVPKITQEQKFIEKVEISKPGRVIKPIANYDYYDDSNEKVVQKYQEGTKVVLHAKGTIECLDIGNFPHPSSCKKFISCARMESGALLGWEYVCPKGLSFDPVGGICNWSAGLGCQEQDS